MSQPASIRSTRGPSSLDLLVASLNCAVREKPGLFLAQRARVGIDLGQHALTVCLGDELRPLQDGLAPDCALVLRMAEPTLAQLLDGSLDPVAALSSGSLALTGDLKLLLTLSRLLAQGQSLLDIRGGRSDRSAAPLSRRPRRT